MQLQWGRKSSYLQIWFNTDSTLQFCLEVQVFRIYRKESSWPHERFVYCFSLVPGIFLSGLSEFWSKVARTITPGIWEGRTSGKNEWLCHVKGTLKPTFLTMDFFTMSKYAYIEDVRSAIITTTIGLCHHEVFPSFLQIRTWALRNFHVALSKNMFFLQITCVNDEGKFHDPIWNSEYIFGKVHLLFKRLVRGSGWIRRCVLGTVKKRKFIMCFLIIINGSSWIFFDLNIWYSAV